MHLFEGVCLNCNKSLERIRSSAKYCSDQCRWDYHNTKKIGSGNSSSSKERIKKLEKEAKKKVLEESKNYEVYAAVDALGNYLYIGSGLSGRSSHCNSGVSHNYELNRLHHTGCNMQINILHNNVSKAESLLLEIKAIEQHKPVCNKQYLKRKGVYGRKYKVEANLS